MASRLKNNFYILAQIPVDPENNKRPIDFKGFQKEVKTRCQELMYSVNNLAENPNDTAPPPGPSLLPDSWVTLGERLAQEVNKSPTVKDSNTDQQKILHLWILPESRQLYQLHINKYHQSRHWVDRTNVSLLYPWHLCRRFH